MANTVIQLKKSGTPSATPSTLANGELAINYADGKLFYKAANGTIVEYRSADGSNFGTINANGTLIVSDTNGDIVTLAPGDNISIVGDAINDTVTISANLFAALVTANAAFDQANLAFIAANSGIATVAVSNTTPPGTANSLWWNSETGDLFIYYIDPDSTAQWVQVGGKILIGNITGNVANTLSAEAGQAFDQANAAFAKANTANQTADLAYGQANISRTHANTAHLTANASYDQANTARTHANTAHLTANAAFDQANTARTHANTAHLTSNASFAQANTARDHANAAFNAANTAGGAGAAFDQANTARTHANTAHLTANAAYAQANTARDHANAAFLAANTAGGAGAAFDQANTARTHANTAHLTANAAYNQANTARTHANSAYGQANTARDHANSAFLTANNALANTNNVTVYGNFTVTGTLTVGNSSTIINTYSVKANTINVTESLVVNTTDILITLNKAYDRANQGSLNVNGTIIIDSTINNRKLANVGQGTVKGRGTGVGTGEPTDLTFEEFVNVLPVFSNTSRGVVPWTSGQSTRYLRDDATWVYIYDKEAFNTANSKFSSNGGIITGDVSVVGNLTVSGNTTFVSAENLRISDPLIYLAGNNYSTDIVDIGWIANYVNATGSNVHTGLYREHEDKQYYLFYGYDKEPANNHLGAMTNNMTLAVLNADLKTSNLNLAGTNAVIWIRSSYDQANTSRDHANAAYGQSNTARTHANTAHLTANAAFEQANVARNQANAAFAAANAAGSGDVSNAYTQANLAYAQANAAFAAANSASGANAATVTIGTTAPGSSQEGDFWFNSDIGELYIYYADSNSSQWVQASGGDGFGSGSTFGVAALEQANVARDTANSAQDFANNYFLMFYYPAQPDANVNMFVNITPVNYYLSANLPGSYARAEIGPAGNTANLGILKNGSYVGNISFSKNDTNGSFIFSNTTSFVPGDILKIISPLQADANLRDISVSILGYKT